jgi:hypothetical protein
MGLIELISSLADSCELILIDDEQASHRIMHARGP